MRSFALTLSVISQALASVMDLLGIHRSGPSFFEISWEGISARRKATLKMVRPVSVSRVINSKYPSYRSGEGYSIASVVIHRIGGEVFN